MNKQITALSLFLGAVFLSCQTPPAHLPQAREVDKVVNEEVPFREQLSEEQQNVVLGVSAPLAALQGGDFLSTAPFPRTRENRKEWEAILSRSWGVDSRDSFYRKINSLRSEGDSSEYLRLLEVVSSQDFDYAAVGRSGEYDSQTLRRLGFLSGQAEVQTLPRGNALRGWDLARAAVLCRWAYQAGYIDENEAWKEMFRTAQSIKRRFRSWGDLGGNIALGRGFWTAAYGDPQPVMIEVYSLMAQLSAPGGFWTTAPWETSLESSLLPE